MSPVVALRFVGPRAARLMRVGEPAILLYLATATLRVLQTPTGVTMYLELSPMLFALLVMTGCGSDRIFFLELSDSTGSTTDTASNGGGGGGGGSTQTGGFGGIGGNTMSTAGSAGATTTTTNPIAGCNPPSPIGINCAVATCGTISGMSTSAACAKFCNPQGMYYVADSEQDISLVFDTFEQAFLCEAGECQWGFTVVVEGPGCVRATVSAGLYVDYLYVSSACGAPSKQTCIIADAGDASPADYLRIVATVDPDNVPAAAWLRIEIAPGLCVGAMSC